MFPNYGAQIPPATRLYQPGASAPVLPPQQMTGLGGIFNRLRMPVEEQQNQYLNQPLPPDMQAEPGVNVPPHENTPTGLNQRMQITPDTMTDTRSAPDQIIDLNTQMNQTFGQGSGPLGDPMQEFMGRGMTPDEYDELMLQLEEETQTAMAGQSGQQDRIYAVSKGLGSYRPYAMGAR